MNSPFDYYKGQGEAAMKHYLSEHMASIPRGIYEPCTAVQEINWRDDIEAAIGYRFKNRLLLEISLESPGSERTCIGPPCTPIGAGGNSEFAEYGRSNMELILKADCHANGMTNPKHKDYISKALLDHINLARYGRSLGLDLYIRKAGTATSSASRKSNKLREKLYKTKEAFGFNKHEEKDDDVVIIAGGFNALAGAIIHDGGLVVLKDLMSRLGLRVTTTIEKGSKLVDGRWVTRDGRYGIPVQTVERRGDGRFTM